MQSETRQNLIFIVVLLLLTVPGGVILFKKKLDPESRILGAPDPVSRTVAYMVRGPTPPGKMRVAPPKTMTWLKWEVKPRVPAWATLLPVGADGLPLISNDQRFQVLAAWEDEGEAKAWVGVWDRTLSADAVSWSGQSASTAKIVESIMLTIPNTVRNELGENGLLVPPKEILLQRLELGSITAKWVTLGLFVTPLVSGDRAIIPASFFGPAN